MIFNYIIGALLSFIHTASHHNYKTGYEAAREFEHDKHFAAKHLAISVSPDTSYAINKAFQESNQYTLFNFDQRVFKVCYLVLLLAGVP